MKIKSIATLLVLGVFLVVGSLEVTGCMSNPDGEQGIEYIEDMTDVEFNRFMVRASLGLQLGVELYLDSNPDDLQHILDIADLLEDVATRPISDLTSDVLTDAVGESGLTETQATLAVLLLEDLLREVGGLDPVMNADGTFSLSPRTQTLLVTVATALRTGEPVSFEEE